MLFLQAKIDDLNKFINQKILLYVYNNEYIPEWAYAIL